MKTLLFSIVVLTSALSLFPFSSTEAVDLTGMNVSIHPAAPTITTRTPLPGAVVNRAAGVTQVSVGFDRAVTAQHGAIRVVSANSGGAVIQGTLIGSGTNTLTLIFPTKLLDGDRYIVSVTTNVKSVSSETPLAELNSWNFSTLVGDCNRDGVVDDTDLERVRSALKTATYDEGCDIQEDGVINIFDLGHVRSALDVAPIITSMSPNVGALGQTVTVEIVGRNFLAANDVSVCGISPVRDRGFRLTTCRVFSDTRISADFTIDPTALLGERNIFVGTRYGTSNTMTFDVGGIPTPISLSAMVLDPNGGETVAAGSSYTIRWESTSISSKALLILLYQKISASGDVVETQIGSVVNTGSFLWRVPSSIALGEYKIKIRYGNAQNAYDLSDTSFNIVAAPQPSITSRAPFPGTVVNRAAGVTQVSVGFDQAVTAQNGDIRVVGINSGNVAIQGTLSGSGTSTLTLSFPTKLLDGDRYIVSVTTNVKSASSGTPLAELNSWNFSTLVGDCNRDGVVNTTDLERVRSALKTATYDEGCDIQEDGVINIFDLGHVRKALSAAPTITCSLNAECNDNNVNTIDTCVNPGTINSQCTYEPLAEPDEETSARTEELKKQIVELQQRIVDLLMQLILLFQSQLSLIR